jgi:hypothetical protein
MYTKMNMAGPKYFLLPVGDVYSFPDLLLVCLSLLEAGSACVPVTFGILLLAPVVLVVGANLQKNT